MLITFQTLILVFYVNDLKQNSTVITIPIPSHRSKTQCHTAVILPKLTAHYGGFRI